MISTIIFFLSQTHFTRKAKIKQYSSVHRIDRNEKRREEKRRKEKYLSKCDNDNNDYYRT